MTSSLLYSIEHNKIKQPQIKGLGLWVKLNKLKKNMTLKLT